MASSFTRFLDHIQRRTTVCRTPVDEWSVRRRDLYLKTQNTHNRQHIHAHGGIRTHSLSRRAAADLRLKPHGHWDRQTVTLDKYKQLPQTTCKGKGHKYVYRIKFIFGTVSCLPILRTVSSKQGTALHNDRLADIQFTRFCNDREA